MRFVPGIGTTSGPWASSQASATWPGVHPVRAGDLAHDVDRREVGVEGAVAEARVDAAHVVLGEVVERRDPPGEHPAAERAERDDADAELAARRHDLVLDVAAPQRPLALQRGDRVHGRGAADRVDRRLRQPEVAHLALGDELGHRPDRLLDRHVRVGAVLVVEVDVVDAEPAAATPRPQPHVLGVPSTTPGCPGAGPTRCRTWWRSTTSSRRPAIALPTASSLVSARRRRRCRASCTRGRGRADHLGWDRRRRSRRTPG